MCLWAKNCPRLAGKLGCPVQGLLLSLRVWGLESISVSISVSRWTPQSRPRAEKKKQGYSTGICLLSHCFFTLPARGQPAGELLKMMLPGSHPLEILISWSEGLGTRIF